MAPALVVLVGVGAGCGGDDKDAGPGSTTSTTVSIDDAVEVAQSTLPITLADRQVADLVRELCDATDGDTEAIVQDVSALPTANKDVLATTITAIGKGAETYCQPGVAKSPNLLHLVYDAVLAGPATTDSTGTDASDTSTTLAATPTSSATTTPTFNAPTTAPPATVATVTATAPCSPAGAEGVTSTGYPMTCATQSCAGNAYDQPRWRARNC